MKFLKCLVGGVFLLNILTVNAFGLENHIQDPEQTTTSIIIEYNENGKRTGINEYIKDKCKVPKVRTKKEYKTLNMELVELEGN